MEKNFEIILENSIILIFFLTLGHQAKFQNKKIACLLLVQLLLAYNFYAIVTHLNLAKIVDTIALVVFILGLISTAIMSKRLKQTNIK